MSGLQKGCVVIFASCGHIIYENDQQDATV